MKSGEKKKEQRRKFVLEKLRYQLEIGTKPEKVNGKTTGNQIPLTTSDKNRIEKEIQILTQLTNY